MPPPERWREPKRAGKWGTLERRATMAKVTLERLRGPYIKDTRLHKDAFRCTRAHQAVLSGVTVVPDGYNMTGPFICDYARRRWC